MYAPLHKSYITQGFHLGKAIDLGWISLNLINPSIHSFDDGVVSDVWFERSGGNCLTIIHPYSETHELMSLYAHLHRIDVVKGQMVFGNQQIGLGGRSGIVSGPHLHYEIWLVPKGYQFNRNEYYKKDREEYIIDPFPLINWSGTDSRKLGDAKMYTLDYSYQGTAKTSATALRMRVKPNTAALSVGHMPKEALCVGKVLGRIDGHEWYAIIHDHRIVFVAASYVTVVPNTKTVEIIKTVEVEKPVSVSTTVGGLAINIQSINK